MGRFNKVTLNEAGKRKLKEAYKELDLTQKSLSEKVGIKLDTIQRFLEQEAQRVWIIGLPLQLQQ